MKKIIFSLALMGVIRAEINATTIILTGTLSNTSLTADNCYKLRGCVIVPDNVILDIAAGTEIRAESGASLIVERGGIINATGTSLLPIVFTSDQPVNARAEGDWAGIAILGEAPNNVVGGAFVIKRCDNDYIAGGNTVNSNSGRLQYLRVEFAGATTAPDITHPAGILLASVGKGTQIENVQVSYSGSNGMKVMGGDVAMESIFILNAFQNDLYFTLGYTGNIKTMLGIRKDTAAHSILGAHGILVENDDLASASTPLTYPELSNVSLLGPINCPFQNYTPNPNFGDGIRFDKNGGANIFDLVAAGFAGHGLFIVDDASARRTATTPTTLAVSFSSFTDNIAGDYGNSVSSWLTNGCSNTMQDWIEGLTVIGCEGQQNQFSPFTLGYDNSVCGDYCSVVPDFILTGSTTLDPSSSPLVFQRGALQFSTNLFDWSEGCPQTKTYCIPEQLKILPTEKAMMEVYPNPTKNRATIGFEAKNTGKATLVVLEAITGRVIISRKIQVTETGHQNINLLLPQLKEGIYPVKIQLEDRIIHGKITIQ